MDDLFKVATGWLGWSPELAMTAPIPQILLATEGRIDWHKKTNPWGSPEKEPEKPEPKASVSDRMRSMFRAMGAKRTGEK